MTVSVLIADDHLVIRQGLRLLLDLDPELDVVGEAGDGREAVYLACQLRPDLVLMDLVMPEMDGLTATAEIRRQLPDTQMLILTGIVDDDAIVECVRAGAIGYLRKDIEIDDLCRAIKRVAAGEAQLAPDAVARLLREVRTSDQPDPLTKREVAVLRFLTRGMVNKEIARELGIAETTVKSHVLHILAKLGVDSRTQAALIAVRNGLVRPAAHEACDGPRRLATRFAHGEPHGSVDEDRSHGLHARKATGRAGITNGRVAPRGTGSAPAITPSAGLPREFPIGWGDGLGL